MVKVEFIGIYSWEMREMSSRVLPGASSFTSSLDWEPWHFSMDRCQMTHDSPST